jgi:hypothetical protein
MRAKSRLAIPALKPFASVDFWPFWRQKMRHSHSGRPMTARAVASSILIDLVASVTRTGTAVMRISTTPKTSKTTTTA